MHHIAVWSLSREVSSFSPLSLPLFQILHAVLPGQEPFFCCSEFWGLLLPNAHPSTPQTLAQRAVTCLALLPSAPHSAPRSAVDGSGVTLQTGRPSGLGFSLSVLHVLNLRFFRFLHSLIRSGFQGVSHWHQCDLLYVEGHSLTPHFTRAP